MVIKTIKNIFFGLAATAFLIAAGYFFFFEREAPNAIDEYYISNIQEQLTKNISIAEAELKALQAALPTNGEGLNRGDLPKTTHPYFLFKNGAIAYWSDNAYVPLFSKLDKNKKVSLLTDDGKIFVVVKNTINTSQYTGFTLIPIYFDKVTRLNGYSPAIFSLQPLALKQQAAIETYKNIVAPNGDILFSIKPPAAQNALHPLLPQTTLKLLGLGILFFGIFAFLQIGICIKRHRFGRAFILFSLFLVATRWLLLVNNLPLINFQSTIFDPFPFSESRWAISLGDRLINAIIWVIILGFLSIYFYRSSIYYRISKSKNIVHSFLAVCCIVFVIIVSYILQAELQNILVVSGNKLDYSLSIAFDNNRIAILSYYLLLSTVFFLFSHCCLYLFTRLLPSKTNGILHWLYGLILSLIVVSVIDEQRWVYFLVGAYFFVVYFFDLSRNFYVFRFQTSLYFFLGAFVFALISTSVLSDYLTEKELIEKRNFANSFFTNKDNAAEATLRTAFNEIENDVIIENEIQRTVLARERVVQQIRSSYLKNFTNDYQSEIYVFDSLGKNLDILPQSKPLEAFETQIKTAENATQTPTVYVTQSEANTPPVYYGFGKVIAANGNLKGSIIIKLQKLSNTVVNSNYLSISNEILKQKPESENYSFALFSPSNRMIYSNGVYNYNNKWDKSYHKEPSIFTKGFSKNGFQHFAVRAQDGKSIIISSPDSSWYDEWANLSFLFFISVLAISLILVSYSLIYSYKRKSRMNFTTRIQLYLNTAFVLPLLLVLIITISVVGTTLRRNQENGYLKNTSSIASTIELLTQDWKAGKMSTQFYEQEIEKLSQNSKIDFTLYNAKGILFYTTSALENTSVFSEYLSPKAYDQLIRSNESQFIATENSDNLQYAATYTVIRKNIEAEKIILRIPYLDSQLMLTKQLTQVVSSILMIFIILFLLLLLASYFVSQQLTTPLRSVTSHIRKTNLDKLNEPLPMVESGDEMGVLIRAYNKMLRKLEESKLALSTSEKQTAWREMAKQVAHEIKNPLTPMKLSIQQLQRTLPSDNPKTKTRIERALNSLNEQIDNISEIANSFSEFAKMPVPRSEDFDLVKVIQNTIDLYSTNKNMDIRFNLSEPEMLVRGDRQLMSRMLTNLIINGLQSVPIHRRPEIVISLYRNTEDNFAIVEVKDNGVGIPEEIREKVFMPSFSTKVGGSGLGLALSKRGIEHAGGNIWFETSLDEGTSFFVDLPVAKK